MGRMDIENHLRSLFKLHANKFAAVDKDRSITYQELDSLSDNLAQRLLALSPQPNERVVLAIDRSVYALVGIVAILKAGLAYIPQEWDGNDETAFDRIPGSDQALFLTRAKFSTTLTCHNRRVMVIDIPDSVFYNSFQLQNYLAGELLYTIFTSGSTGVSKGVDISCSNVLHYQSSLSRLLGISEPLNYAYVSSLSADLGNTSIFLSLFSGGTLHLIDDVTRRDAARFQNYLAEHYIDVLKITPSHFTSLCEDIYSPYKLQWLIFGGETLSAELAKSVLLRGLALNVANHYGPTEATIGAACYPMRNVEDVPESGSVPVGFPIGETVLELIDEYGKVLPQGKNAQGELLIGGPGVGIGYYNDLKLTERKFTDVTGRPEGGRFYVTGDLFLRTEEGAYFFIGRKDRQVKVRGYRVDLEAIESVILKHCNVSAAVVLPIQKFDSPHIQLIAAIVPNQPLRVSPSEVLQEIQDKLKRVLPNYMLPARVQLFDSMPITSNGKMDLKAVKAAIEELPIETSSVLDLAAINADSQFVALAHQAWIRYTGSAPTSIDENFYTAGGDSILAIQLLSALQSENVTLTPTTFYTTPTFAGLIASFCPGHIKANHESVITSERHLSPIQHWFFEMFPEGPNHWAQTVLIDSGNPVDQAAMQSSVKLLLEAYPILSTMFTRDDAEWVASDAPLNVSANFSVQDLNPGERVSFIIQNVASSLKLSFGELFHVLLLRQKGQPDRLAVICHHLVVDGVSWRILLDDLARLYSSALQGATRTVAVDRHGYWSWSKRLKEWAKTLPPIPYDNNRVIEPSQHLLPDFNTGPNDEGSSAVFWLGYDESSTYVLLHDLTNHLNLPIQDILLACFVRGIARTFECNKLSIPVDIETHGRHLFSQDLDLNRAVGWFTALSPWTLDIKGDESLQASAERIQHCLDGVAHKGVEYAARCYLAGKRNDVSPAPELCFNYLGHFTLGQEPSLAWSLSSEYPGATRSPSSHRIYQLKFTGRVVNGQLAIDLSYSTHRYAKTSVEKLMNSIQHDLSSALADIAPYITRHTPRQYFTEQSSTGLLTYMPATLRQAPSHSVERRPRAALLTGATGFIGIYLLRELLAQHGLEVHCLVRSTADKSADSRLWDQFRWYFPNDNIQDVQHRVFIHDGDIRTRRFDLDEQSYTSLISRVDTVFHSAADVRLLAPLDELRLTNVQGTRNVIDFCRLGKSKKLHFISTLSVAGVNPGETASVFSEDDLHCNQSFLTPYEQSKYESEVVVRQFISSGGRAYIHRTGSVSADANGTFQVNIDSNRVMQSICTYVLSGVIPSRDEDLLLCPVDRLVSSLVSIAMNAQSPSGTFHLTPPQRFMNDELLPILRNLGFNVRLDTEEAYLKALESIETSHPREAALGRLWAARISRGVIIDANRTNEYLQRLGSSIQPIDEEWFSRFLNRCVERGYLPTEEITLSNRI
ncbi:thioester reductase domain-containing protein [Dickeya chrysanthemi]|uniref:thioester reductase domain-containing protein n=1 Tax=Dickeya chrysanthemi TaxID=556 RepID=UPI001CF29617|nr:thioester reductase domain-containing protein [Dickeya chrysanthemi]MCA7006957.1 thioester reductase domain-containing protein [Dickeya chrysanthemi]